MRKFAYGCSKGHFVKQIPTSLNLPIGRLDVEIEINVPTVKSRQAILTKLLQQTSADFHSLNDEQIFKVAQSAHGFVAADLHALCRAATSQVNSIFNIIQPFLPDNFRIIKKSSHRWNFTITNCCDLPPVLDSSRSLHFGLRVQLSEKGSLSPLCPFMFDNLCINLCI